MTAASTPETSGKPENAGDDSNYELTPDEVRRLL